MENGKIIEDGNPKELNSNPSAFKIMLNAADVKPTKKK
jgi:ABC-type multidrug transport system fused ATPase/permease subunit